MVDSIEETHRVREHELVRADERLRHVTLARFILLRLRQAGTRNLETA